MHGAYHADPVFVGQESGKCAGYPEGVAILDDLTTSGPRCERL